MQILLGMLLTPNKTLSSCTFSTSTSTPPTLSQLSKNFALLSIWSYPTKATLGDHFSWPFSIKECIAFWSRSRKIWNYATQRPIWFLQLWVQLYFKNIFPLFLSHSPPGGQDLGALVGHHALVGRHSHWSPTEEDWCLILERRVSPKWIVDMLLPDTSLSSEERQVVADNCCQVLVVKDLVTSYRGSTHYSNMFAEYYSPNFVAR